MNYIELNGVKSTEISGLIIQELPPISKPLMRTTIEEIDGRDGDIVTKLGYSAIDKTIQIGLSFNYNVDDVIKYFNSEGVVTFSNEPNKYYNYQILEQIDFEKLIRFKTASVVLHCQPFKYSTTEEDIEVDATETSGEGTSYSIDKTENGASFFEMSIKGNTTQNGTPTPTSPVNVDVVKGKNLYGNAIKTSNSGTSINTIVEDTSNRLEIQGASGYYSGIYKKYQLNPNTQYTISTFYSDLSNSARGRIYYKLGTECENVATNNQDGTIEVQTTRTSLSFTTDSTGLVAILFCCNWTANNGHIVYNNIQLEQGSATPYLPYNTIQAKVVGKNLFDGIMETGKYADATGEKATDNSMRRNSYPIPVKPSTKYIWSNNGTGVALNVFEYNSSMGFISKATIGSGSAFTTSANTYYLNIYRGTTNIDKLQLEKGQTISSYEAYKSQTYPITLGDLELCKIGDYQDKIYKENGKWYLEKQIGKVVLNGSESWSIVLNIDNSNLFRLNNFTGYKANELIYCNYYKGKTNQTGRTNFDIYLRNDATISLDILDNRYTSVDDFKTWLGTHNTIVYYALATPTTTEITDETLLEQLEALKSATTYTGVTNISTSGNLAPIMYVKTYTIDNTSYDVVNSGNIYSKPIITIYGIGEVGVYLNNSQMFSIAFDDEATDNITIDVANMEAYTGTTQTLRNRAVTGDYSRFLLATGHNEISFSGTIQGFVIQNYSRWL